MRFSDFVKDLGDDTAQTPALLDVNANAFSNRLRGIEVVQISHIRFRTIFLDRFTHGQFFERLTEVKHFITVRNLGGAQNILRQRTEQRLRQFDQVFVVRIRHIEFHHGELRIMAHGDAFVTEVTVNFEYAFEAANHQTLEVQFRRDTQVHVQIQRVVMGDKRTGRRAAWDHLHHRRFDFHKAASNHKLANTGQDLRTGFEGVTGFIVRDEIQITLAIARFLVLQAVEFIRQRTQRFRQQAQFGAVDRQLAGFGFEQLTFRAEDIAKIPLLELLVVNAFRQIIARHIQLNAAAYVLQGNKRGFTHNTASHHTARDGHFNIQRFQFFSFFRVKLCVQLV